MGSKKAKPGTAEYEGTKKSPSKMPKYRAKQEAAEKALKLDPEFKDPNWHGTITPEYDPVVEGPTKKNPEKLEATKDLCKARLAKLGLESFSKDPTKEGAHRGEPAPLENVEVPDPPEKE